MLLLSLVDRLLLLMHFGSRYTGSDDSILWLGASDYARLVFHEPYFYGQDYNPMLESLMAAPLIALGFEHRWVMPVVSCLLGLAPYWAFGVWHQRRGEHLAATAFAAMPVLLPIEFAISTMITRGFVTGLAALALWPWAMSVRRPLARGFAAGLVLTGALFFNPNAAPFAVALGLSFMWAQKHRLRTLAVSLLGALPFTAMSLAARAWYKAHPAYVLHTLYDWRLDFHPEGIVEGAGSVGRYFQALGPWPVPGAFWLIGGSLLIIMLGLRRREWPTTAGLFAGWCVVIVGWCFAKTHDGELNAFFPISRMYLSLPLMLLWAAPLHLLGRRTTHATMALLAWTALCFGQRVVEMPSVVEREIADCPGQVRERDLAPLALDAARIQALSDVYHADALLCLDRREQADCLFVAYLYPVLASRLPPTYLPGNDRRYWIREAVGRRSWLTLLVLGGDAERWAVARSRLPGVITAPPGPWGTAHIIPPDHRSTDSLMTALFN